MKNRYSIILLAIGASTLAACLGTSSVQVEHSVVPRKDYAVQLANLVEPITGVPRVLPSAINATQGAFEPCRVSSAADAALDSAIRTTRARLEVAAHNLANAHTIGFKRSRILFEDAGYRTDIVPGTQDAIGNPSSTGIALGTGSKVFGTQVDLSQGVLHSTCRPFDLAIEGRGFFQLTDPTGAICYSRSGAFAVNGNSQMCHASGVTSRLLEPMICIPKDTTNITIGSNGLVQVAQSGTPSLTQVGQLQIAIFFNSEGLRPIGECLYAQSDSSGPPIVKNPGKDGAGKLSQKTVELSNVDIDGERAEWREAQQFLAMLQSLRPEAVTMAKP